MDTDALFYPVAGIVVCLVLGLLSEFGKRWD